MPDEQSSPADEVGGGKPGVEIPLGIPTAARMYDEALGGKDHFAVDRAAVAKLYEVVGEEVARSTALANRSYLGRLVTFLARERGIRQFIDMGSGLPTVRNTHEIAQEVDPGARVVYVDLDPIVAAHGNALLSGENTRILTADLRDPEAILDDPLTREMIDFTQPVAVLYIAVFHFISRADDPARIVATIRERQAPGSYLAISHLTTEGMTPETQAGWTAGFANSTSPIVFRDKNEVLNLFEGYELVEPGLVLVHDWRPDAGPPSALAPSVFGGVGRIKTDQHSSGHA